MSYFLQYDWFEDFYLRLSGLAFNVGGFRMIYRLTISVDTCKVRLLAEVQ